MTIAQSAEAPAPATDSNDVLLSIQDLRVSFFTHEGEVRAVDGVSLDIRRGRTMAVVGESGCGKSVTSYSILRLIQRPGRILGGSIRYQPKTGNPVDVLSLDEKSDELFDLRGGAISMIFQEPMTALSPVHTVGNQIMEAILLHQDVTEEQARERTIDMLSKVGIPGAEKRIDQYPFEMSGGMRQRVVIAMALVCNPDLLIADEPTTALDVTIQAQILGLMKQLQARTGTSILLITHDLGVVAQTADDVAVKYLGRIVERADVRTVMKAPRHPYTQGLLASLPSLSMEKEHLPSIKGSVPSLTDIPPGCPFHPRCPHAKSGVCDQGGPPPLTNLGNGHTASCYRLAELAPSA
jgi:oligopeptide/dipeptide ABC transporter ATP-binding protein